MPLGRANLFFDQIEIVEQPFAGGRDPAVRLDCCGQQIAGADQHAFVRRQTREQLIASAIGGQLMRRGEQPAMLLHLLGAEELRAKRRLFGLTARDAALRKERREAEQLLEARAFVRLQFTRPTACPGEAMPLWRIALATLSCARRKLLFSVKEMLREAAWRGADCSSCLCRKL